MNNFSWPDDEPAPVMPTPNSRVSYVALWVLDSLLLVIGSVVVLSQTVFAAEGPRASTEALVWGELFLGLGAAILLVVLFLNAFTGGPYFIRQRGRR